MTQLVQFDNLAERIADTWHGDRFHCQCVSLGELGKAPIGWFIASLLRVCKAIEMNIPKYSPRRLAVVSGSGQPRSVFLQCLVEYAKLMGIEYQLHERRSGSVFTLSGISRGIGTIVNRVAYPGKWSKQSNKQVLFVSWFLPNNRDLHRGLLQHYDRMTGFEVSYSGLD